MGVAHEPVRYQYFGVIEIFHHEERTSTTVTRSYRLGSRQVILDV